MDQYQPKINLYLNQLSNKNLSTISNKFNSLFKESNNNIELYNLTIDTFFDRCKQSDSKIYTDLYCNLLWRIYVYISQTHSEIEFMSIANRFTNKCQSLLPSIDKSELISPYSICISSIINVGLINASLINNIINSLISDNELKVQTIIELCKFTEFNNDVKIHPKILEKIKTISSNNYSSRRLNILLEDICESHI